MKNGPKNVGIRRIPAFLLPNLNYRGWETAFLAAQLKLQGVGNGIFSSPAPGRDKHMKNGPKNVGIRRIPAFLLPNLNYRGWKTAFVVPPPPERTNV